jgi:hypothetical protein
MVEARTKRTAAPKGPYYTTAFELRTASTSTPALMVWHELSRHLSHHKLPMTAAELTAASGMPEKRLEEVFAQAYYKRWYGFRRFASLAEFQTWADDNGIFHIPAADEEMDEVDLTEEEPAAL